MQRLHPSDMKKFIDAIPREDWVTNNAHKGRWVAVHIVFAEYKEVEYMVATFETFVEGHLRGANKKTDNEATFIVPRALWEAYGGDELCNLYRVYERDRTAAERLAYVEMDCARRCREKNIPVWFNVKNPSKF